MTSRHPQLKADSTSVKNDRTGQCVHRLGGTGTPFYVSRQNVDCSVQYKCGIQIMEIDLQVSKVLFVFHMELKMCLGCVEHTSLEPAHNLIQTTSINLAMSLQSVQHGNQ